MEMTMKDVAEMVEKFDIYPFSRELVYQGKKITGARRVRVPVVKDRIEAARYSKDIFGYEAGDAILAGIASAVLRFGVIVKEEKGIRFDGDELIPVDFLIDNLEYGELMGLASLMGKSRPSSTSQGEA